MITILDIPNDLKLAADRFGFDVEVEPMIFAPNGHELAAAIRPRAGGRGRIVVSGSLESERIRQEVAHELGHAEQWNELGALYWKRSMYDPMLYFNLEMDAVERGKKWCPDMSMNFQANYHGYIEFLGLEHMGRS